jgi:serine/threonine-protein kinase
MFRRATRPRATPAQKNFQLPKPGDLINCEGRLYRLGNYLGEGYYGAVYECTDDWSNRLVAKVLLPKKTYEGVREDWLRELKALTELRHPHITFVHDAFECKDTFYLILERCESTLQQLFTWPGLVPDAWFKPLAQQLLQAVHFIHMRGYVHKDIHPGNIFVARIESATGGAGSGAHVFKLGDLGISRLEPELGVHQTVARWMIPPEALDPSQFGSLGKQLDIYHAGLCLLGLMLKGVPQFSEADIREGKPRMMAEQIPHPGAPAIAQALRRHVKDRTQSAMDFWRDLKQYLGVR